MRGFVARVLGSRAVLPTAAVLTALLAWPALESGFIWDDLVQRDVLVTAGPGQAAMDLFRFVDPGTLEQSGTTKAVLPWWTASDLRLSFWRPLSALTHWADNRLIRDDARLQHVRGPGAQSGALPAVAPAQAAAAAGVAVRADHGRPRGALAAGPV
jgi:hypothetical protein